MRIHDISISLARLVVFVFAALGAASCGRDVQVENQGRLCVFPASDVGANGFGPVDPTPRQYVAGEPLLVSVVFDLCLSSSCSTDRMSSCTVEPSGSTFRVNASGSYREVGSGACSADCGTLSPSCATQPVSEGTFTFTYAGGSVDLVVPSTVAPPCIGHALGS
jgi:hypothetical protein